MVGVMALVLFSADNAYGATSNGGLVPCGMGNTSPCTLCHLVIGVNGIIKWGMSVMTFFAIAIITAMGIVYIVSAGNSGMMTTAKNGIKATLIGFSVMLGSWVIINLFMTTLAKNNIVGQGGNWYTFTCDTTSSTNQIAGTDTTKPVVPQNLPIGCNNYKDTFASVAQSTGVDKCLLEAIAGAESGCTPSATSSHGACGMMQLLPETAHQSCDYLQNNPNDSVKIAAEYLKTLKSQISGYPFAIGEDDLIAAYNAGPGAGKKDGKKQAFAASSDCPGLPAWQCTINPYGFEETQNYVAKTLSFKASCQ